MHGDAGEESVAEHGLVVQAPVKQRETRIWA